MMPLDPTAILNVLSGAVKLVGGAIDNFQDRQVRKAIAGYYDEMFRRPEFPFRSTATLAKVTGDTSTDHAVTRALLQRMIVAGIRHNTGTSDTWFKADNWVLDDRGRIAKDAEGHGILRPGVEPGLI